MALTHYQRQAQRSLGLCLFGLLSLSVMLTSLKGDVGTRDSVFKQLGSGPRSTLTLGTFLQWGLGREAGLGEQTQGGQVRCSVPQSPAASHLAASPPSLLTASGPCLTSPDVAVGWERGRGTQAHLARGGISRCDHSDLPS